jgi:hypothetical protein
VWLRPLSRTILEPAAWLANESHVQCLFVELPVSLISGEVAGRRLRRAADGTQQVITSAHLVFLFRPRADRVGTRTYQPG